MTAWPLAIDVPTRYDRARRMHSEDERAHVLTMANEPRFADLFLIMGLYSRKIIGWEVHDSDGSGHATHLVRRTALAENLARQDPALPGAAWRQWRLVQGHLRAGDAALAGHQAVVFAPASQ